MHSKAFKQAGLAVCPPAAGGELRVEEDASQEGPEEAVDDSLRKAFRLQWCEHVMTEVTTNIQDKELLYSIDRRSCQ
jgi:hypothetical protein